MSAGARRAALSWSARRASSARAAATATAVAGGSATVGRVPSWPQEGRAGTDGPDFPIVYLAEVASHEAQHASRPCV